MNDPSAPPPSPRLLQDEAIDPSIPKPVEEAKYLAQENSARYRVITFLFFQRYQLQQHRLKPKEVWEYVRRELDRDYTLDDCIRDLDQLHAWGNLEREQDREAVGSIEEWYNRDDVYELTPWTVRFERMLQEARNDPGTRGSLDPTLVEVIRASIEKLDRILDVLTEGSLTEPDEVARRVRQPWDTLFNQFERLTTSTNDYHHALREAYRSDLAEIEALLIYKDILLDNLEGFVNELIDAGRPLRSYTRRWRNRGLDLLLVETLSRSKATTLPTPEQDGVRREYERQVEAFVSWFQRGGGMDALRRTTGNAIQTVVRLTVRRVDRSRVGGTRREHLVRLASAFARAPSLGDAHALASLTLGSPGAHHVHGSSAWLVLSDTRTVWEQPAFEVALRPSKRGRPPKPRPSPVIRTHEEQRALLEEERRRQRAEAAQWDRLFRDGPVALVDLEVDDPELRDRILEALDSCLASPDDRGSASDGSIIELRPPAPGTEAGRLRAPDGDFYLPAFTLVRLSRGDSVA